MRSFKVKVGKANARLRLILSMVFGVCIVLMAWPLLPESRTQPLKLKASHRMFDSVKTLQLPGGLSEVTDTENLKSPTKIELYHHRQTVPTAIFQDEVAKSQQENTLGLNQVQTIAHPDWVVPEGTVMTATLLSAVNTDLPGLVKAMISRPVKAWQGGRVLIPSGSEVIGEYQTKTMAGQHRIFIIWHRLLLPGGRSVKLQTSISDALGRGGVAADHINHHFWAQFGQASLLSLISGGLSAVHIGDGKDEQAALKSELSQDFRQTAGQNLSFGMGRGPTLSLKQGQLVTILVHHDLLFWG